MVKQISVFVQNEKGALVGVLDTLAAAHIEIRALSIADTKDFGILRMITDNNDKASLALAEAGFISTVTEVIAVCTSDRPGGLAAEIKVLSDAGINLEYLYAFVAKSGKEAYVVLRVDDNDGAEAALNAAGVTLLSNDDIAKI